MEHITTNAEAEKEPALRVAMFSFEIVDVFCPRLAGALAITALFGQGAVCG